MPILALRTAILALFVASATLALSDVEIVLGLLPLPPLLLLVAWGTYMAGRPFAARLGL